MTAGCEANPRASLRGTARADAPADASPDNTSTIWLQPVDVTTKLQSSWIERELFRQAVLIAARLFGFNEAVLLGRHFQAIARFMKSVPRALRVRFVVVRLEGTVAAGQLDLWHKIMKRAKRLGGLEIEFACEHLPSGKTVTALSWNAPAPHDGESLYAAADAVDIAVLAALGSR